MWHKKDILRKGKFDDKNETFFQTGISYETKKKTKVLPENMGLRCSMRMSETVKRPFLDFSNVDGIGLLKNPFEPIRKVKKEKV